MNYDAIVKLHGGLGNQMFIYAFAKKLESLGFKVALDISWYNRAKNTNPSFNTTRNCELLRYEIDIPLLKNFNARWFFIKNDAFYLLKCALNKCKINQTHELKYKNGIMDSLDLLEKIQTKTLNLPPNAYFYGYFQSYFYIESMDFISLDSINNVEMKERIKNAQDSCFLHIRRGDYIESTRLSIDYYQRAIDELKKYIKRPKIFIFSNDDFWAKNHFLKLLKNIDDIEFCFAGNASEADAVADMELMRSCKHAIIANSSFSYLAAHLIKNENKLIFAPNKFTADSTQDFINALYPKSWRLIEANFKS